MDTSELTADELSLLQKLLFRALRQYRWLAVDVHPRSANTQLIVCPRRVNVVADPEAEAFEEDDEPIEELDYVNIQIRDTEVDNDDVVPVLRNQQGGVIGGVVIDKDGLTIQLLCDVTMKTKGMLGTRETTTECDVNIDLKREYDEVWSPYSDL